MIKVLVTGKNGNISTAIADYLSDKKDFYAEQTSLRGEKWKQTDFSSFDVAVHVAGIVPKSGVKPEDFYEINYKLTEDFALKAKECGIKQFVYISSMAVYGLEPQTSSYKGTVTGETPCNPLSDYGKSKLLAEESLKKIEADGFKVTVIRVPSIYGVGKTEYLDQYKHLAEKFRKIPQAFTKNYKSMIYIDNLCELIYLAIENGYCGTICPDDGEISAFDICKAISPNKKVSKIQGLLLTLLKNNARIKDYYGAVCYSKELTEIFDGKYRVCDFKEAIRKSYER